MTVSRDAIKQQIAAARGLLITLQTRSMRPRTAATDVDQLLQAYRRLERATESLAREFYAPKETDHE